jgi:NCS1 family nucleobase:cation symporter-1
MQMAEAVSTPTNDAFLQVEAAGIEPIPAGERHGRPRELGFLWAGAFVNYASLLTASLLTNYFGLGVWDGFAAVVVGSVAGALLLGLLSNTGPATGEPQIVFTRRIFGTAGARLGALLTLFLGVGWFAVDTVIAAQAGAQLVGGGGRAATFIWVLLVAAASVGVAVYGHATIKILETWGAVIFLVLAAALFASLAPQMNWAAGAGKSGADYPAAFILGAMSCFALIASWYPFTSDYSRYIPADCPRRWTVFWPVVGITVPMVVLGLFGLLVPTIDPKLAASDPNGPIAVISKHAPAWVAAPFFLFVIVGEIWANYLDVYTAGLVTLTMGVRLRRWQTALGCGILGAALAAYAVLISDFHTAYTDFLILTYLWAPAWAAVVLLAFYFFDGRSRPMPALVSWLAGTAVSLVFVNYPNLFGNVFSSASFPNQPLVDALHGADLSGLVSVGVAAGLYLALRRV